MDFDQKQWWLTQKRENREFEEKIQELEEVRRKPYYARLDIKSKNDKRAVYIGENRYIYVANMSYNVESVWSKYGKWLRDTRRNIVSDDGVNTSITLRRKFSITNGKLEDYYDEYDADSKGARAAINDPFLLRVLEERRGEQNITNIIRSIQVNQNDIIEEPIENNIVVQGCAGSGKTMILLHRLANLKYNNPKFDWDKVRVITPNKDFTLFISDLAKDLDINEIKKITLQEYYLEIIDTYNEQFQLETDEYEELISGMGEYTPKRKRYSSKIEAKRVRPDKDLDREIVSFLYSDEYIETVREYIKDLKNDDSRYVNDFGVAWNYFDEFISDLLEARFKDKSFNLFNYTCVLYVKALFLFFYLGKLRTSIKLLCVDEGQDICENQYVLLYHIYREKPNINIYGDLNQRIIDNESISNWDAVRKSLSAKIYTLNENYRNSDEIINYYNRTLSIKNKSFGIKTKEVERFKVEELDILLKMQLLLKNKTVVIIKDSSRIPKNVTSLCIKNGIAEDRITVMDVAQVKGLEFDTAFVFDEGMDDNEKYISYTRALSELYVENGDHVATTALGIAEGGTNVVGAEVSYPDEEPYFDDDIVLINASDVYITMLNTKLEDGDDDECFVIRMSCRNSRHLRLDLYINNLVINNVDIVGQENVYIPDKSLSEQIITVSFYKKWLSKYVDLEDIDSISFSITARIYDANTVDIYESERIICDTEGYLISDYEENGLKKEEAPRYRTILELDEMNDEKCLLVVRAGWTNDYCFCVEEYDGKYAVGTPYLSGVERKRTKYRADIKEFKMYEGISREVIENQYV